MARNLILSINKRKRKKCLCKKKIEMYKKIKCELKDVSCEFISKFLLNAKNSIRNYFFSKI